MRLYELLELGEVPRTEGKLRQADPSDHSLMIQWTRAFQNEIGESANRPQNREVNGSQQFHFTVCQRPFATVCKSAFCAQGSKLSNLLTSTCRSPLRR